MNKETAEAYQNLLARNYAPPALALVRGEGCRVWDDEGREYLDFTSGIAVNALGHAHPRWVAAIAGQAAELAHCSNLFANPLQARLARLLSTRTPPGRFIFVNSGTEANEALIKLARLHGRKLAGAEGRRFGVLVATNGFHGRTFGSMGATPQEKIQGGFRPMLEGFAAAPLNDIGAFRSLVSDQTAAIMVETIQGEGGIHVAEPGFLRDLRSLCDEHGILLILDEVQCGIGRTGRFFAFDEAGVEPDAIGMAKGLGGGFPVGGIWYSEKLADLFQPGSHGTTFGGSPLACAAACAVLDEIAEKDLLGRVQRLSPPWHEQLRQLAARFPALVGEVRGRGYLVGIGMLAEPGPIVAALRENGILCPPAGNRTIRLLPPLTASAADLEESVRIFGKTLSEI